MGLFGPNWQAIADSQVLQTGTPVRVKAEYYSMPGLAPGEEEIYQTLIDSGVMDLLTLSEVDTSWITTNPTITGVVARNGVSAAEIRAVVVNALGSFNAVRVWGVSVGPVEVQLQEDAPTISTSTSIGLVSIAVLALVGLYLYKQVD